jgi:hypothetical protein
MKAAWLSGVLLTLLYMQLGCNVSSMEPVAGMQSALNLAGSAATAAAVGVYRLL